jgi:hypothetical protein
MHAMRLQPSIRWFALILAWSALAVASCDTGGGAEPAAQASAAEAPAAVDAAQQGELAPGSRTQGASHLGKARQSAENVIQRAQQQSEQIAENAGEE